MCNMCNINMYNNLILIYQGKRCIAGPITVWCPHECANFELKKIKLNVNTFCKPEQKQNVVDIKLECCNANVHITPPPCRCGCQISTQSHQTCAETGQDFPTAKKKLCKIPSKAFLMKPVLHGIYSIYIHTINHIDHWWWETLPIPSSMAASVST